MIALNITAGEMGRGEEEGEREIERERITSSWERESRMPEQNCLNKVRKPRVDKRRE